jgi:hypothetical protein
LIPAVDDQPDQGSLRGTTSDSICLELIFRFLTPQLLEVNEGICDARPQGARAAIGNDRVQEKKRFFP